MKNAVYTGFRTDPAAEQFTAGVVVEGGAVVAEAGGLLIGEIGADTGLLAMVGLGVLGGALALGGLAVIGLGVYLYDQSRS